jgi:hypothetical protein
MIAVICRSAAATDGSAKDSFPLNSLAYLSGPPERT